MKEQSLRGRRTFDRRAAMAAFIPFAAVIVLSSPVEPFSLKAAIWAVGIILTSVTHVRWVPLQKR
jgi:hypothetical protein